MTREQVEEVYEAGAEVNSRKTTYSSPRGARAGGRKREKPSSGVSRKSVHSLNQVEPRPVITPVENEKEKHNSYYQKSNYKIFSLLLFLSCIDSLF